MGETAMHLTHKALTGIDIAIIAVYFTIIFGIGAYFARKERTSTEYFSPAAMWAGSRSGASLFVSNISTEHFIGLAGSGASSGLAVGSFEWLACLILLILGWVFVPFYLRSNVFTMPWFLERRFSRGSAIYLASISIIAYVLTKISVHLWAAAIVLKGVVGWSPLQAAVIPGGRDRNLYRRGRTVSRNLHRGRPDPGSSNRRDRAYSDRHAPGGRLRRTARGCARQLLSYGQADERPGLPLDRNFLRRADSGHMVLVHRPGDCAARALGPG